LFSAFIGTREPLTFDELVARAMGSGARVSDIAAWLASSEASGLIKPAGFATNGDGKPLGPRLFTLTERGERIKEADRRRQAA
jgi:hypothetical protein